MMKSVFPAFVLLLLTGTPVPAHHAFAAEYDENRMVKVSGTVTKFDWFNPHAWLHVEGRVAGQSKTASWDFEMGSPNGLVHRGWNRNDVKVGDHITVDGYCAKDGSNKANARTVALPDGRKLFGGFATTPGAPPQ
jgi:hypothetical protein